MEYLTHVCSKNLTGDWMECLTSIILKYQYLTGGGRKFLESIVTIIHLILGKCQQEIYNRCQPHDSWQTCSHDKICCRFYMYMLTLKNVGCFCEQKLRVLFEWSKGKHIYIVSIIHLTTQIRSNPDAVWGRGWGEWVEVFNGLAMNLHCRISSQPQILNAINKF